MKLYISGPITGVRDYRENFAQVEEYLNKLGYDTINPAELDPGTNESHEFYLKRDIKLMVGAENVDGLVLIPGWVNSEGAVVEIVVARATGMRIFQLFEGDLMEIEEFSEAGYMQMSQTLRRAVK